MEKPGARWGLLRLGIVGVMGACPANPNNDATSSTDTTTETGQEETAGEACWPDDPPGDPEDSIMLDWGSACETDEECIGRLGEGAVCMLDAIIFELPGGYCSKQCTLPDSETTVVKDAQDCDPEGGVLCVGAQGIFERCVLECTGPEQCAREGYFCRLMPLIAREGDPTVCMMDDCCQEGCAGG